MANYTANFTFNLNGDYSSHRTIKAKASNSFDGKSQGSNAGKRLNAYIATTAIKPFISNIFSNYQQTVGIKSGSEELQQRRNFQFRIAGDALSGITTGAQLGSSFGLIGAGVGAVVGLVGKSITNIINYSFKKTQLNLKKTVEDVQLTQTRERAGYAYNKTRS